MHFQAQDGHDGSLIEDSLRLGISDYLAKPEIDKYAAIRFIPNL
jgi:response regulator of citrate/malate metabolism